MRLLQVGHSEEVRQLAVRLGHTVVAAVDPARKMAGISMFSSDEEASGWGEYEGVVLAIDDPTRREIAFGFYASRNQEPISLIAGLTSSDCRIGPGAVIRDFAFFSANTCAGKAVVANVGVTVTHDCQIGDFVSLAPNAVLLGGVSVGSHSYIGANATVLPGIMVGIGCMIGAGSVVTRNVPDGTTVKGNPAR